MQINKEQMKERVKDGGRRERQVMKEKRNNYKTKKERPKRGKVNKKMSKAANGG